MLSVNKPLMDTKFNLLTVPQTGAVYKAAYNAYYNLAKASMDRDDGTVEDSELNAMSSSQKAIADMQMKEDANKFAMDFCEGISEMLKEISAQIDAHVKAIDFMIVEPSPNPTTGTTLANAGGPAAGVIMINTMAGSTMTIM